MLDTENADNTRVKMQFLIRWIGNRPLSNVALAVKKVQVIFILDNNFEDEEYSIKIGDNIKADYGKLGSISVNLK